MKFRRLSAGIKRDSCPVPQIDECIGLLGVANILSLLDANSGYWLKDIDDRLIDKTASVTHK